MNVSWAITDQTSNKPHSVSWAVTDQTSRRTELKRHETFHGYFTDIQRVARRSLPKRPSQELRDLLGLRLVPAARTKLPSTPSTPSQSVEEGSFGIFVKSETPAPAQDAQLENFNQKQSASDKLRSLFKCSGINECSWREKTICGCNVYFGIIIFLLLIIVIILASTISVMARQQDSDSNSQRSQVSVINAATPSTGRLTSSTTAAPSSNVPSVPSSVSESLPPTTYITTQPTVMSTSTVTSTTFSMSSERPIEQSTNTAITLSSLKSSSGAITSLPTTINTADTTLPTSTNAFTTHSKASISSSNTQSAESSTSSPQLNASTPSSTTPSSTSVSKETLIYSTLSSISSDLSTTEHFASTIKSTTFSNEIQNSSVQPTIVSTQSVSSISTVSVTSSTTVTSPQTTVSSTPSMPRILEKPNITCSSSKCESARVTIERADFDTSPCEDFFQFSCGAWAAETFADWQIGTIKNVPLSIQDELRQGLLLQVKDILEEPYADTEALGPRVSRRLYQSCIESNVNKDRALGEVERVKCNVSYIHSSRCSSPISACTVTVDTSGVPSCFRIFLYLYICFQKYMWAKLRKRYTRQLVLQRYSRMPKTK